MKFSNESAFKIDKVDVNYRFLIDSVLEVVAKNYLFEIEIILNYIFALKKKTKYLEQI